MLGGRIHGISDPRRGRGQIAHRNAGTVPEPQDRFEALPNQSRAPSRPGDLDFPGGVDDDRLRGIEFSHREANLRIDRHVPGKQVGELRCPVRLGLKRDRAGALLTRHGGQRWEEKPAIGYRRRAVRRLEVHPVERDNRQLAVMVHDALRGLRQIIAIGIGGPLDRAGGLLRRGSARRNEPVVADAVLSVRKHHVNAVLKVDRCAVLDDDAAAASGIVIQDGTPIDLENGVHVMFSNGQYSVGDYWLIPARTATTQQTTGTIEWPTDANGDYLPQAPKGVVHHYCKLAIVAFDGVNFQPPHGSTAVTDCRLFFPPLTAVASQESPCTITLQPEANWTAQLADLFPGNVPVDAEICFAVGEFDATQPVVIDTTGKVKVTGAGWGTRLIGQGLETVLRFRNCASVSVRDLSATATRVGDPVDAATKHIGGSIEFDDCAVITVDTVDLSCASAAASGAACLTVRNTITAGNTATGAGKVGVRNSRFTVGEMQYGMLLVHVASAVVEGNVLRRTTTSPPAFSVAIASPQYRKLVERILVGRATQALPPSPLPSSSSASSSTSSSVTGKQARALRSLALSGTVSRGPNAAVKVGSVSVNFQTPPQIRTVWQTFVDTTGRKDFASSRDLLNFVKQSAATLLTNRAVQQQFSGFSELIRFFERNQSTIARAAIVVGGRAVTALRVENNVIDGFLQGVVVGVSHRETAPPAVPADSAGNVVIRDNRIGIVLDPVLGHAAGRYAIYVGNVDSLQIENNRATLTLPAGMEIDTDGIRVIGYLGRKMIVRHNHVSRFQTGIRVVEVTAPGRYDTQVPPPGESYLRPLRQGPLWLVADNVLERVARPIQAIACMQIDNTLA